MKRRKYETIAPELFEYADRMADDLEVHGYRVRVEKNELGFPDTPTMLAKRERTTLVVEVDSSISFPRLNAWTGYGKSCGHDLRVIVCLPDHVAVSAKDQGQIRQKGCGLTTVSSTAVASIILPLDLALNVALPERLSLPTKLKALLGSAYDQFEQGSWRECFEEACRVFEIEARRYLKHWIRTRRIQLVSRRGPRSLTAAQIDRLTMGQLADTFKQIVNKTQADSQVEMTLAAINKDRIAFVHHKHRRRTESQLRANMGRHMWAIIGALKLLL